MSKKQTTEEFINKAREIHGDMYDYSLCNYINDKNKVKIICHKLDRYGNEHGTFTQRPYGHLTGKGCQKCKLEKLRKSFQSNSEEFINRAVAIHGDKYDYSNVNYINNSEKVRVTCKKHGNFEIAPAHHLNRKQGCRKCYEENRKHKQLSSVEEFIKKSKMVFGEKYDYSKVDYQGSFKHVEIICPGHGSFFQMPTNHLGGHECSKCVGMVSKPELEIAEYINSLGFKTESSRRDLLGSSKEVDIFIPELNIGIEYNGLYWHSETYGFKGKNYHLEKLKDARDKGIRLIHIFEDEWINSKDKVKSLLSVILDSFKGERLYARKLRVSSDVTWKDASYLLDKIHLQGRGAIGSYIYGLYKENRLISCMVFSKNNVKEGQVELIRFCSDGLVVGGFSKLLRNFLSDNKEVREVISFSDNRWSNGNVYEKNGFKLEYKTEPSYYWCSSKLERKHRRHFQKKYLKEMFSNYDDNLTEKEICEANGLFKIWDCGLTKWKLQIK